MDRQTSNCRVDESRQRKGPRLMRRVDRWVGQSTFKVLCGKYPHGSSQQDLNFVIHFLQ